MDVPIGVAIVFLLLIGTLGLFSPSTLFEPECDYPGRNGKSRKENAINVPW